MAAVFTINQAGLGTPGDPNTAREDGLAGGQLVTLLSTAHELSYEFDLLWVGIHPSPDTTSRASLQAAGAGAISFSPTAGVYGTWRVELVTDRGTPAEDRAEVGFAIKQSPSAIRIPAANERSDPEASLQKNGPSYLARSTFNAPDGIGGSPFEAGTYVSHYRAVADLIYQHNAGGGGGGGGAVGTTVIVPLDAGSNVDVSIANIKTVRVAWCQVSDPGTELESILRPPPAAGDPAPGDYHSIFLVNGSSSQDLTIINGGTGSYGATFVTASGSDKVLGPYEGVLLVYLHFVAAWQVITLG